MKIGDILKIDQDPYTKVVKSVELFMPDSPVIELETSAEPLIMGSSIETFFREHQQMLKQLL